jgi:hypothetical protein
VSKATFSLCRYGLPVIEQPLSQRLREIREAQLAEAGEPETAEEAPAEPEQRRRAPLGRLLVEKGLLSEGEVDAALERQSEDSRPLGQILIEMGVLSPQNLARTLTEQHGFDFSGGSLRARLAVGESPPEHDDPAEPGDHERYLVVENDPADPLHVADTFLDAADVAFEVIEDRAPEHLEIVRSRDGELESLWSYRPGGSVEPQLSPG